MSEAKDKTWNATGVLGLSILVNRELTVYMNVLSHSFTHNKRNRTDLVLPKHYLELFEKTNLLCCHELFKIHFQDNQEQ